ncbi:endo alpha-1,4 polygalactosaminidase [Nocardia transvalensis]|uniref:endo alpha-1,4 polygalactosaminidase n=1 Tax=Nocardia transvalensis TaxID=37333 RepID=UPI002B4B8C9B|nr:endo alpha-1,4 polygalactosaminidase [Nocardia transvalensis]
MSHLLRAAAASVAVLAALSTTGAAESAAAPSAVTVPPPHAGFDYQIGGPYSPPPGVAVVARDHTVDPAPGVYNICYVNAFQAQPGAEGEWDPDLLLRDDEGNIVWDTAWQEALLDLRTDDKRQRIARKVNGWIDECAAKGYQGVEPDNYDSFSRSNGLLGPEQAQTYIRLLSAHAHDKNLAIAQKNTSELAENRRRNGLDFAVAEECGEQQECGDYVAAFDDNVIVIEYTDDGLSKACSGYGDRLSIVQRDRDVLPQGEPEYIRKTC